MKEVKNVRVLMWDIESSLMKVATFHTGEQRIHHENILQDWTILCGAWKYLGEKKIYTASVLDMPESQVVAALAAAVENADIVVGHNGDKFDLKKLRTRMLFYGQNPLPKIATVDTLKVLRSEFGMTSNTLAYAAKYLGLELKGSTPGGTWLRALEGDKKSLKAMLKYNAQDVVVLEDLYNKILPWIKNHPNVGLLYGHKLGEACPNCGSPEIIKNGKYGTTAGIKQRMQCLDCGTAFNTIIRKGKNSRGL